MSFLLKTLITTILSNVGKALFELLLSGCSVNAMKKMILITARKLVNSTETPYDNNLLDAFEKELNDKEVPNG